MIMMIFGINKIFSQNQWKKIQRILRNIDLNYGIKSEVSDSLIKYINQSSLDSCKNSNDTTSYECYFSDFSLSYLYKTSSLDAYIELKNKKKEKGIWLSKKPSLYLMIILKKKCSTLK